jgi:conjugal transfer pilus assembly protein TraB
VVFQDGFQLKTIEELEAEKNGQQQAQNQRNPNNLRAGHSNPAGT